VTTSRPVAGGIVAAMHDQGSDPHTWEGRVGAARDVLWPLLLVGLDLRVH
jgi:hypothetical protein